MAHNTPKPSAGDAGPREDCASADRGHSLPTTSTELPEQASSTTDALSKIEPVGEGAPAKLRVFEDARREIADAKTAEHVNRIIAMATGLAAAARKATDREMEAEAEVLKLEAERRLGQLMQVQRETFGLNKGGGDQRSDHRGIQNPGDPPTLAEAGIDKNLAKKARAAAAAMSEAEFKEAAKAKRDAVRTRSKKKAGPKPIAPDSDTVKAETEKPKAAKAVSSHDTALTGFTERVLDLVRRISNHKPKRFAKTAVKPDDLAKLGKFFADLAALKTGVAS